MGGKCLLSGYHSLGLALWTLRQRLIPWEVPVRRSASPSVETAVGKDPLGLILSKRSPRGWLFVPARDKAGQSVHLCQFPTLPGPDKREKVTVIQVIILSKYFWAGLVLELGE